MHLWFFSLQIVERLIKALPICGIFSLGLVLSVLANAQTKIPVDADICVCAGGSCNPSNQYTTQLVDYKVKKGETLSQILLKYGVGAKSVPFCLYEPKRTSWMDLNMRLNSQVSDWQRLEPGTKLRLVIPVLKSPESNYVTPTFPQPRIEPPKPQPISWGLWATRVGYQHALLADVVVVGSWSEMSARLSKRYQLNKIDNFGEYGVEVRVRPQVSEKVIDVAFSLKEQQALVFLQSAMWRHQEWYLFGSVAVGVADVEGGLPDRDIDGQLIRNVIVYDNKPALELRLLPTYSRERWHIEAALGGERVFGDGEMQMNRLRMGATYRRLIHQADDERAIYLGLVAHLEQTAIVGAPAVKADVYSESSSARVTSSFSLPFLGFELDARW